VGFWFDLSVYLFTLSFIFGNLLIVAGFVLKNAEVALLSIDIFVVLAVLVISALPLYFAVKLVGGEAGLLKVILIGLLLSLASAGATRFISMLAGVIMILLTFFAYKVAFKLGWIRAFIAWILQYIFILVTLMIISVI